MVGGGCHLLRTCEEGVSWVRGGLAKIGKRCYGERGKGNRETKNDLRATAEAQAEAGEHESEIARSDSVVLICFSFTQLPG